MTPMLRQALAAVRSGGTLDPALGWVVWHVIRAEADAAELSGGPSPGPAMGPFGSGTIMKKIAVTVAVLALGLAACQDNAPDNASSTENTIETEAATDVNAATDDADTVREHARRGGFPADLVVTVAAEFGPGTADS